MPKLKADGLEPITITALDDENYSFFMPFLPREIISEIEDSGVIVLGAIVKDIACGIIVAKAEETRAQLLWIYVAEDFRRQYIGSTLFCEMADFLRDPDEYDLEWVFCRYAVPEDDDSVRIFFDSLKFKQEETEEQSISLTLKELAESEIANFNGDSEAVTYRIIADLPPFHLHELNAELDRHKVNYIGAPISRETVILGFSTVMYRGKTPTGCLCISEGDSEKELIFSVLFINERDSSAIKGMFRNSALLMIKKNPPDLILKIPIVLESAGRMAKLILKDKAKICEKLIEAKFYFKQ